MELLKIKGIILKTMDYKERDKLVHIFSEEKGRLTLIAKGARGRNSKYTSSLMAMNICDFVIFTGRTIHNLNELNVYHTFPDLKTDYEIMTHAMYFLELCDIAMPDGEINPGYFMDLIKGLYLLESGSLDLSTLTRAFELKTLIRTGNYPDPELHGSKMTRSARDVVHFMMNKGLEELIKISPGAADLDAIAGLTEELLKDSFQRKPKCLEILKESY